MAIRDVFPEVVTSRREVVYPESDGEPLGETDVHVVAILHLLQALRHVFRDAEDVYVGANMLLYYEEGNPEARISPDVFVVRGLPRRKRRTYKVWEERAAPCTVIEVTSRSSRLQDVGTKRGLYELLGVGEYLLFDPLAEYLHPPFQVYELEAEHYRSANLADGKGYHSRILDVTFVPEGDILRVVDPRTLQPVPLLEEAVDLATAQCARAEQESIRAEQEARHARELEELVEQYRARFGPLDREPSSSGE